MYSPFGSESASLTLTAFNTTDFAPLYNESMVMAQEGHQSDPDRPEPEGLCNAVILAEPYARFIVSSNPHLACLCDSCSLTYML